MDAKRGALIVVLAGLALGLVGGATVLVRLGNQVMVTPEQNSSESDWARARPAPVGSVPFQDQLMEQHGYGPSSHQTDWMAPDTPEAKAARAPFYYGAAACLLGAIVGAAGLAAGEGALARRAGTEAFASAAAWTSLICGVAAVLLTVAAVIPLGQEDVLAAPVVGWWNRFYVTVAFMVGTALLGGGLGLAVRNRERAAPTTLAGGTLGAIGLVLSALVLLGGSCVVVALVVF